MCQQEENNDIITIDINTQEVIVTRNEFDKKGRNTSANVSKNNIVTGAFNMQSVEDIRIDDQDDPNRTVGNFARIEAENGVERLLIQNLQVEEADREQLSIEVIYRSERNFLFIISSVSFIAEIKRVSYFIVKKTYEEVRELIANA